MEGLKALIANGRRCALFNADGSDARTIGDASGSLAQNVHALELRPENLMQTDILLTWGALFGTVMLLAYSTVRK